VLPSALVMIGKRGGLDVKCAWPREVAIFMVITRYHSENS